MSVLRRLSLRTALVAALGLSAVLCAAAQDGAGSRAILDRGTYAVKGLPFFSPNAIPCLMGEYLFPAPKADLRIPVWYTREPLVFGAEWARRDMPPYAARVLLRTEGGRQAGAVLSLATARYTLFLELPSDSAAFRDFAVALEQRFAVFFASAPSDAELSFPAYVDIRRPGP
jgi:hypothetical protein